MRAIHIISIAILFSVLAFSSCDRKGPGERAGEKIGKTTKEAGKNLDKTRESIKDTLDKKN